MIIGVPKETSAHEYRVGMDPIGVRQLCDSGHEVLVETNAGTSAGFFDTEYEAAGAKIVSAAEDVWYDANMIVKVLGPHEEEFGYLRKNLVLFAYLHLAADPDLTRVLEKRGISAIAMETIQLDNGSLPLLKPMSEIAGRLGVQHGAYYLEKTNGGRGVLLGGIPGVKRATVTIIGGGVVGTNAAKIAVGMGADTYMLDINLNRLEFLDDIFQTRLHTLYSNTGNLSELVERSDLLIGAVLIPGARAPKLVTEEMVRTMKPGSVLVDASIDQGGIVETIRPTTHENPAYERHNVIHYGVANMPSAVSRTSTQALANASTQYVLDLARKGLEDAVRDDASIFRGVNIYQGHVTYEAVAEACGVEYRPLSVLL